MLAKPIVKNKFWIIEDTHGEKVGTIQTVRNGSNDVVLVTNGDRIRYPSITVLANKHKIKMCSENTPYEPVELEESSGVYGYLTEGIAYNGIFDVEKNIPVYTKDKTSKSFYAAGHYLLSYCGNWVKTFCPKLLTLERTPYEGPFKTVEEMKARLAELKK